MSSVLRSGKRTTFTTVALVSVAAALALIVAAVVVAFVKAPSGSDLQARVTSFARQHEAKPVSITGISPWMREALVATEDERFYRHRGVDLIGLLRAIPYDVTHFSSAQGASTITEQLAKILYLSGNDHSPSRKLTDIALGFRLGHRYTHERILDDYLNVAYFGEGRYGIEAASQFYFGKRATRLGLNEASLLAGLVQAPTLLDPLRNPLAARERQVAVLAAMVRNGYATKAAAESAARRVLSLRSGSVLPLVGGVSFADPAPFDWAELVAASAMLLAALLVLLGTRLIAPALAPRVVVRLAGAALLVGAVLTAAHSVQTL